ncbi:hypothetical protein PMAYCL1PPCAC_00228, partial [Pristionchus mayeri]
MGRESCVVRLSIVFVVLVGCGRRTDHRTTRARLLRLQLQLLRHCSLLSGELLLKYLLDELLLNRVQLLLGDAALVEARVLAAQLFFGLHFALVEHRIRRFLVVRREVEVRQGLLDVLVVDGLALVGGRDALGLARHVSHEFGAAEIEQLTRLVSDANVRNHVLDDHVESLLRQADLVVLHVVCHDDLRMLLLATGIPRRPGA